MKFIKTNGNSQLFNLRRLRSYYAILEKHDVSHIIGLVYIYPMFVALLSYFFLHEQLTFFGYVGVSLVVIGSVLLSLRIKKIGTGLKWILICAAMTALAEFFVKFSTQNVPIMTGISVTAISTGLTTFMFLLMRDIRHGFFYELKNFKYGLISETCNILGVAFLYLAMFELPATIVSSVAAVEPLFVLGFEKIVSYKHKKIVKDKDILKKSISIILIIIGVILLYLK